VVRLYFIRNFEPKVNCPTKGFGFDLIFPLKNQIKNNFPCALCALQRPSGAGVRLKKNTIFLQSKDGNFNFTKYT